MIAFGTVCSGIGAPETAWAPLGWRSVFASEIDAFPRAVLAHRYPETPVHGDFTTIQADDYGPIDVLCGGTPCQSFSVAGLRGGLADERGNLALAYIRLAGRLRPRWVVWENVPGVLSSGRGRDFGSFLGALGNLGYGFAWRVLDAQYFGLAQRRKRVFVVGHLGDWRPAAAVLFEPESLRGHPAPGSAARKDVAAPLVVGSPNRSGYRNDANTAESLIPVISPALKARDHKGPSSDGTGDGAPLVVTHSLRADGFDASEDGTGRGTPLVTLSVALRGRDGGDKPYVLLSTVRRLTPRECERLQGFPDDFTLVPYRNGKLAADGPRYKAIGNSMAVPVVRWIGERIQGQHVLLCPETSLEHQLTRLAGALARNRAARQ